MTPWAAARQASPSITNSPSFLKLVSIQLVKPSTHLILCGPLLLLPSVLPRIRVFSSDSVLRIRWPKYQIFSFSVSPSSEYSGPLGQLGLFLWPPRTSRNQSERQSLIAEPTRVRSRRFREETSEGETVHLAERRCCRPALSHVSRKSPGRGVGGSGLSPPCWLRENQRLLGPTGYHGGPGRGVGGSDGGLSPPCWLRENQKLLGPTGYHGGPEASMCLPPDSVYRGGTLSYKRKGAGSGKEEAASEPEGPALVGCAEGSVGALRCACPSPHTRGTGPGPTCHTGAPTVGTRGARTAER